MSASFFQKFRPPGSSPIVSEKRVVKTNTSPATTPTKSATTTTATKRATTTPSPAAAAAAAAAATADARRPRRLSHVPPEAHPRRVQSSVILAVSDTRPSTAPVTPNRDLETSRSPPNLKRGPDQLRPPPATVRRPPPTLKRPASAVHHREFTKPPSPDAIPHHVQRSSVSSRSPRSQRLESSDEESSEDERISKRSKIGSLSPRGPAPDATRRLVHAISFRTKDPKTGQPLERCKFIHAETIAGLGQPGWSRRKGSPLLSLPPRTPPPSLPPTCPHSLIPATDHHPPQNSRMPPRRTTLAFLLDSTTLVSPTRSGTNWSRTAIRTNSSL